MPPEAMAMMSTVAFAASHVVSKRGLTATSVTGGFLVAVTVAWLVVMAAVAFELPTSIPVLGVILFGVSGLFAPATARAAALMGVDKLGPSIAVPIQQGLRPLLVLPAAALLLNEGIGPLRVLGVLAIVSGGWFLSRSPERSRRGVAVETLVLESQRPSASATTGGSSSAGERRSAPRFRPGLVYPIVAAVAYAAADLIVKRALDELPHPEFGAMVAIGAGLSVWVVAHLGRPVRRRLRVGPDAGWFVVSGGLMGAAILLLFNALEKGEVSVVVAIVATQPLFVFVLSALLLGGIERIHRSTILAGVLVVIGTILVSG